MFVKAVFIYIFLFLSALLVWRNSFAAFFAQDDFILISHFSQNPIFTDLKNAVDKPTITHWRPVHNLFFVTAGNLFGKNYYLYHVLVFIIFVTAGFGVYKATNLILRNEFAGLIAGFLYLVNPLHFVSLYWVSGSAPIIGFSLFIFSFYFFVKKKFLISILLFTLSILTLESMIAGIILFLAWEMLQKETSKNLKFLASSILISGVFVVLKFSIFSSKVVSADYNLQISFKDILAFKYYFLRTLGFGEVSGDVGPSILILVFLGGLFFLFVKNFHKITGGKLIFLIIVTLVGFIPFVFLPNHLSPHYMTISLWGFSMICGAILSTQDRRVNMLFFLIFLIAAFLTVDLTQKNNWVITRSNTAKYYLDKISKNRPPAKSTLIFRDDTYSSFDAYVSLGQGKAIDFWFKNKNYSTCFTFINSCE